MDSGIDEIPGDQTVALVCYINTLDGKMTQQPQTRRVPPIDKIDALEDLEEVQLDPDHPDHVVKIGTYLGQEICN